MKKIAHIMIVHLRFVEKFTGSLVSPFSNSTYVVTLSHCASSPGLWTYIEGALVCMVLLSNGALFDICMWAVVRVMMHIVRKLLHVRGIQLLLVRDVLGRYAWVDPLGDRVAVDDADVLSGDIVG